MARGSLGRLITQPRTSLFEELCTLILDTCLDSAVQLRLEGGEDVDAVLEVALVHRLLGPPHRHEQRATDQRVLLSPSLARLPPEKYGSKVTGTVFQSLFNIQNQFQHVFEPQKRHHLKQALFK